MLPTWNLHLLLLLLFLPLPFQATSLTGGNFKEFQQPDSDTAVPHLAKTSQKPHISGLAEEKPMIGTQNVDFLGQPLSLFEESNSQDMTADYSDLQKSRETSHVHPEGKGLIRKRTIDSSENNATSKESSQVEPTQELQTLMYQPAETRTGSFLQSTQTRENKPAFPDSQSVKIPSHLPFLLPGSLKPEHFSTSPLPGEPSNGHTTPPVATGSWGWTTHPSVIEQGMRQEVTVQMKENGGGLIDFTDSILHAGVTSINVDKDDSSVDSKADGTAWIDGNMATSATPCKISNQSSTHTFPDDFPSNKPLHPSLAHTPAFFVPLYSDWNSALATWGFAWEAHIYGLGSVFTVIGLISVICLLGLPLRCPPGILYLTLLHFFLLAFAGVQAYRLLYDAYSHQDQLPPLGSLILSELPFPCLMSSFSLAILLLSLHSRMNLSLANLTSFSFLPKPCLLMCMSLLHFVVSLGCAGMLQLFNSLPTLILLFPHGMFVCLTILLSCSYLIFYCLMRFNTKHIYRLNDNGENGGSPDVMQPTNSPFAKVEDWGRAAGAGVGASLCLLGCGGLQLYGILHALGFGGVDGYGFQPWPWWSYQVSCRLCEGGVCLGLSLIGACPLFCHKSSSVKTITHSRPRSWTQLSYSSPSQVQTLPLQTGIHPPVLSSHNSLSQNKQEQLVVCDVINEGQSETLPLFSMVDPLGNELDCVSQSSQTQNTLLHRPTSPNQTPEPQNAVRLSFSSLASQGLDTDSTIDLQPPSPINLSRSIDHALFSDSLFSGSIFGLPRLFHGPSSISLNSPSHGISQQGPSSVGNTLYRTTSCGDVHQENAASSKPSQANVSLTPHSKTQSSPEQWDWRRTVSGPTKGLCRSSKETGKLHSNSWVNRGQNFAQSSLPRAINHLPYFRRYRTLSLASQESHGSGRLAGTKHLSESKQLEWELAVQAEFVSVCKQIDALSVCSDTIEL